MRIQGSINFQITGPVFSGDPIQTKMRPYFSPDGDRWIDTEEEFNSGKDWITSAVIASRLSEERFSRKQRMVWNFSSCNLALEYKKIPGHARKAQCVSDSSSSNKWRELSMNSCSVL